MKSHKVFSVVLIFALLVSALAVISVSAAPLAKSPAPKFSTAVAIRQDASAARYGPKCPIGGSAQHRTTTRGPT
jgi:hypothetical protein